MKKYSLGLWAVAKGLNIQVYSSY